eukprot:506893_1
MASFMVIATPLSLNQLPHLALFVAYSFALYILRMALPCDNNKSNRLVLCLFAAICAVNATPSPTAIEPDNAYCSAQNQSHIYDLDVAFCYQYVYDIDLHPLNHTTQRTVHITGSDGERTVSVFTLNFASFINDCINPRLSFRFENIDYDEWDEALTLYDDDFAIIARCSAVRNQCNTYTQCLDEYDFGIDKIEVNETYTISIYKTDRVHSFCSDLSVNAQLTLHCSPTDEAPAPRPILSQTGADCSSNDVLKHCWHVTAHPLPHNLTKITVPVQYALERTDVYLQVQFTPDYDCIDPRVSFEIEHTSFDCYKWGEGYCLQLNDETNNESIGVCTASDASVYQSSVGCGVSMQCINDYSPGVNKINANDSYIVTIFQPHVVQTTCKYLIHDYSVNAKLTFICNNDRTAIPTLIPTTIPTAEPTAATQYPTTVSPTTPTFMPTTNVPTTSPTGRFYICDNTTVLTHCYDYEMPIYPTDNDTSIHVYQIVGADTYGWYSAKFYDINVTVFGYDCNYPLFSLEYEKTQDTRPRSLHLYSNDTFIARCVVSSLNTGKCGSFSTCLDDMYIGIPKLMVNQTHLFSLYQPPG